MPDRPKRTFHGLFVGLFFVLFFALFTGDGLFAGLFLQVRLAGKSPAVRNCSTTIL